MSEYLHQGTDIIILIVKVPLPNIYIRLFITDFLFRTAYPYQNIHGRSLMSGYLSQIMHIDILISGLEVFISE